MRCQPLRRALVSIREKSSEAQAQWPEQLTFSVQVHNLAFEFFLMLIW